MKKLSSLPLLITVAAFALTPFAAAQKVAPKPLTFSSPKYPTELVDSGMNGVAEIDVLVKADGSVSDPVLKSADNPAFGTEAMAVISQWKFTPGSRDGAPVDMRVTIPFQFRAPFEQKINAMAKRKVYLALPEPPMTGKAFGKLKIKTNARPAYPAALAKSGIKGDVKVNFVVAPDGTVVNPILEGEPNPQFIVASIAAVSQMVYDPPKKGGKGVYVEAFTTLHFEEMPAAEGGRKGGRGRGGDDGPPAGDP